MDADAIWNVKEYWRSYMEEIRIKEEEKLIIEERRLESLRIMEE